MKGYESLHTRRLYFVQKPWKKMCSCFWIYFLCYSKCVAASQYISCFLKNGWLVLKDINVQKPWKKMCSCLYLLLFKECVAASRNNEMFFDEYAAASEKIFNDCFWKKKNVFLKKNYVHLKAHSKVWDTFWQLKAL